MSRCGDYGPTVHRIDENFNCSTWNSPRLIRTKSSNGGFEATEYYICEYIYYHQMSYKMPCTAFSNQSIQTPLHCDFPQNGGDKFSRH